MRLVYIDDSQDSEYGYISISAVVLDASDWRSCHDGWLTVRDKLERQCGLKKSTEIHATDIWCGNKNRFLQKREREERVETLREILKAVCGLKGVTIINGIAPLSKQEWLWERIFTRIDRAMEEYADLAFIICDEGKPYDDLLWKLRYGNLITRRDGSTVDRKLTRIVEDLFYRPSKKSHFVQIADVCAYAVLRMQASSERHREYGIDRLIEYVADVCLRKANRDHPLGIITIK